MRDGIFNCRRRSLSFLPSRGRWRFIWSPRLRPYLLCLWNNFSRPFWYTFIFGPREKFGSIGWDRRIECEWSKKVWWVGLELFAIATHLCIIGPWCWFNVGAIMLVVWLVVVCDCGTIHLVSLPDDLSTRSCAFLSAFATACFHYWIWSNRAVWK